MQTAELRVLTKRKKVEGGGVRARKTAQQVKTAQEIPVGCPEPT